MNTEEAFERIQQLLDDGAVTWDPRTEQICPVFAGNFNGRTFCAVHYQAETDFDVVKFDFDSIGPAPGGVYFYRGKEPFSYLVDLAELVPDNEVSTIRREIKAKRSTLESAEFARTAIRNNLFE